MVLAAAALHPLLSFRSRHSRSDRRVDRALAAAVWLDPSRQFLHTGLPGRDRSVVAGGLGRHSSRVRDG